MRLFHLAVLPVLCAAAACGSPTSPSSTSTTITGTLVNDVFTGTVGVPVGGVMQSAFHTFTVTTGSTPILVTLTSAVETFADGSLLPTVTMSLSIGTVASGVCSPLSNATVNAQGSATAQLGGTIGAGTYCVQVADITNQLGPVQYAITVQHY